MDEREEYNRIIDGLKASLEALLASGVAYIASPEQVRPAPEEKTTAPDSTGLRGRIMSCSSCRRSGPAGRSSLGEGPSDALLVFVGGAPGGAAEAGLLTKMIEAMGFNRGAVYMLDSVRCASSTGPSDEDVAACRAFVEEELSGLSPEVIVTLGPTAALSLLKSRDVDGMRGRFHEWRGVKVMPTYGPGELLSDQALKKAAWDDLKMVMDALRRSGG